ncbi:MAG: class I SAM-dependent methyltransferase [Luteimonas sp.]
MTPDLDPKSLQRDWEGRLEALGATPRAVLMKGVPDRVNGTIDRWHRSLLRVAFSSWPGTTGRLLDVGCGYGRLAGEARACGARELVGVDFSAGFARHFARQHGSAVCANLARLPFADDSFSGAYVVTALMYLDAPDAREALVSLDRCCSASARFLLIEPGAEFNRLARRLLRRQAAAGLTRPGFTAEEFDALAPASWHRIASGASRWFTVLFPLLVITSRWQPVYALLERVALRLDRGRPDARRRSRYSIYRWAIYESARSDQPMADPKRL